MTYMQDKICIIYSISTKLMWDLSPKSYKKYQATFYNKNKAIITCILYDYNLYTLSLIWFFTNVVCNCD